MRMTMKDNKVMITMTPDEALDCAANLILSIKRAQHHGQWFETLPMGINQDGAEHDMPGVVYLTVKTS